MGYTLKQLFGKHLAMGEFRWRFICAVTEDNVKEAIDLLKQDNSQEKIDAIRSRGGMWSDYEGDIPHIKEEIERWHNASEEDWNKWRTFSMGSWCLKDNNAIEQHRQREEEENALFREQYKRGIGVLYNHFRRLQ